MTKPPMIPTDADINDNVNNDDNDDNITDGDGDGAGDNNGDDDADAMCEYVRLKISKDLPQKVHAECTVVTQVWVWSLGFGNILHISLCQSRIALHAMTLRARWHIKKVSISSHHSSNIFGRSLCNLLTLLEADKLTQISHSSYSTLSMKSLEKRNLTI